MKIIFQLVFIYGFTLGCFAQAPDKSETVKLNGVEIYYEVYGSGEPLFLLHGYTQSSTYWHKFVPSFKDKFKVYLVDLKGHGRSSPFTSEFSMQAAADDFLALLDYLELDELKAIGLSYGGELLLQFCTVNSHRIKFMIIIGADFNFPRRDWGGEDQIRAIYEQSNNYEIILTDEQLGNITTRALLAYGEKDRWFPDLHKVINLHNYLPDSHLWIVPNTGHLANDGKNKQRFIDITNEFLSGVWEK
jgi:pimeloyl-ACP methyl ester carboxylesterase